MNERLISANRGPIRLGRELGRGGEGAVFELADHSDFVAKLYHRPPDANKAEKLRVMAGGCTARLRAISAWPVDIVLDATGGTIRGFVMKRVARQKDIHVLYGPKTRLRDYPEATYRFLVHVASNVARAFAVVHDHGHVIGDVNQGGVCVSSPEGTVTLVDCDSFQVAGSQRVFGCEVGIPIYQPPEFQLVRSFHGLARTSNHDNFGLAVLLFQTLFLARHPFAGAFQGDGEMPIERAIREFRFAYASDAARRQMKQPPGTIGLEAAPTHVAELFQRAFTEAGAKGNRPAAIEWVTALDDYSSQLRDCPQNHGHAYLRTLSGCPLCAIEGRSGVLLFLPHQHTTFQSPSINIEELWRGLVPLLNTTRLPHVSEASVPTLSPPDAVVEFKQRQAHAANVIAIGIAVSVFLAMIWHRGALVGAIAFPIIALVVRGRVPDDARNIANRVFAARRRFNAIIQQIERERATSPLAQIEGRAESLYRRLRDFPQRKDQRIRDLERTRHERQLQRYLDQFEVKDARVKHLGPGLVATLVSHGVETAEDVSIERITGIRGFGPKRIDALVGWRRSLESRFRFNQSDPAHVQDRARVERELQIEYAKEVAELRKLAEQVKAYAGPLGQRIGILTAELARAQREFAMVRATAVALGKAA